MFNGGPKPQAKDAREYLALIDQAIAEVEDLRDVITFEDGDDSFVEKLASSLKTLKQSLDPANPQLTGEPLPFMRIVEEVELSLLPFKNLLLRIDATNRLGYGG